MNTKLFETNTSFEGVQSDIHRDIREILMEPWPAFIYKAEALNFCVRKLYRLRHLFLRNGDGTQFRHEVNMANIGPAFWQPLLKPVESGGIGWDGYPLLDNRPPRGRALRDETDRIYTLAMQMKSVMSRHGYPGSLKFEPMIHAEPGVSFRSLVRPEYWLYEGMEAVFMSALRDYLNVYQYLLPPMPNEKWYVVEER